MAVSGYWKNWERNTAWLMREIVFAGIAGNPNIEKDNKPKSVKDIYRISDDEKVEVKKQKQEITPEDIEYFKNVFKKDI
jgi:hypothetical protein